MASRASFAISPSSAPTAAEALLRQAGLSSTVLESEQLRAVIVPALGGKIVSLLSKRSGTEWLLPPLQPYASASPLSASPLSASQAGGFEHSDGGGFDECLPTVAASGSARDPVPDHGDLWRVAWQGGMVQGGPGRSGVLDLQVEAKSRPLRLSRRAAIAGACLTLHYELTNIGRARTDALYSAHPLLHVEAGDRIVLPSGVTTVQIENSNGDRLGRPHDTISWPMAGNHDLSVVRSPDGLSADKLFAGPLREGVCGIFRPSLGEGVRLRFDPAALPYLGIWICHGAWPAGGGRKQHTVALEPTTSDRDALDDARRSGSALWLEPGKKPQEKLQEKPDEEPGDEPGNESGDKIRTKSRNKASWTLLFDLVETEASCRQTTP
jgi:galactose mutarotase-like enzyme